MTKKIVSKEVRLCDTCGQEKPTVECSRCHKDMCGDCRVYLCQVTAQKHYPSSLEVFWATTTWGTLLVTEISVYVCGKCHDAFFQELKAYMGTV